MIDRHDAANRCAGVRTLRALLFSVRILIFAAVLYNATRLLPADRASKIRSQAVLRRARRIARFFMERGGIYIKAAQYLSTVSNLFDAEFTEIFARVANDVEVRPYATIRERFVQEFRSEPEELYAEFSQEPLTAASLGQVHVARIRDGRKVAVKFLHPNMEGQIRVDLRSLRYAVRMTRWFFPQIDFSGHLTEFSNMLLYEVDYRNEAENMRLARVNFGGDERVVIPQVIPELSCATVITSEFIEGIPISDLEEIDRQGIERKALTELLLECYARMIFRHRFYHADPHPGNIFVIRGDAAVPIRLGFVDFGAVQFVTDRTLSFLQRFVEILRSRDISALVDLAVEAEALRPNAVREHYITLGEFIYARYSSFKLDDYYRINPMRFGRMLKMRDLQAAGLRMRDIIGDVQPPRRYIYLARTFTMVISLAMRLDSRVNIFMLARPHVDAHLGPRRRGFLSQLRRRNWVELAERALTRHAGIPGTAGPGGGLSQAASGKTGALLFSAAFTAVIWALFVLEGRDLEARWTLLPLGFFFVWLIQQLRRIR